MDVKLNERGQIAIWVIIAFIIVVTIGLLFFLQKKPLLPNQESANPQALIESCARKSIYDSLDIMMPQGGFVAPKNYKKYNNINVTYLCENIGYFNPCINQHPLFLNEIKEELYTHSLQRIEECFEDVKAELEKQDIDVDLGEMKFNVSLAPNRVRLNIERPMTLSNKDQVSTFKNFDIDIIHPVYNIASVANEIASQEAKYCAFEYLGYMVLHPEFDIRKFTLSDTTKIYTIKDIISQEEMNIAIRGCAIPGGL